MSGWSDAWQADWSLMRLLRKRSAFVVAIEGTWKARKRSRKHSCMIEHFLESLRQSCVVSGDSCGSTGYAWPNFEKRAVSSSQCLIR